MATEHYEGRPILKPCPFCGAPAEYDSQHFGTTQDGTGIHGHSVYCSSMECNGRNGIHETAEEAIAAWNRRAG